MLQEIQAKVNQLKEDIAHTNTRSYPLKAGTQRDWVDKLEDISNDLKKALQPTGV